MRSKNLGYQECSYVLYILRRPPTADRGLSSARPSRVQIPGRAGTARRRLAPQRSDMFPPFLFAADIISTVEFNHTGELLATGDKGGRVVIFQQEIEVGHSVSSTSVVFL